MLSIILAICILNLFTLLAFLKNIKNYLDVSFEIKESLGNSFTRVNLHILELKKLNEEKFNKTYKEIEKVNSKKKK